MCGGSDGSPTNIGGLNNLANTRAQREQRLGAALDPGLIAGYQQGSPYRNTLLDYSGGVLAQGRANRQAGTLRQLAMAGIDPNSAAGQSIRASQVRDEARAYDNVIPGVLNSDLAYRLASARTALGSTNDPVSAYMASIQAQNL